MLGSEIYRDARRGYLQDAGDEIRRMLRDAVKGKFGRKLREEN